MVNEERAPDLRCRMDVDPSFAMCIFGEQPGQQRCSQLMQPMCHAMNGDGMKAGIGRDHLFAAGGCRVEVQRGLNVSLQCIVEFG